MIGIEARTNMKNKLNKFMFKNNFKDYLESSVEYINKEEYKEEYKDMICYIGFLSVQDNDKLIEYFKANNIGLDSLYKPIWNKEDFQRVNYVIDPKELNLVYDSHSRHRTNELINIFRNIYGEEHKTRIIIMNDKQVNHWYRKNKPK